MSANIYMSQEDPSGDTTMCCLMTKKKVSPCSLSPLDHSSDTHTMSTDMMSGDTKKKDSYVVSSFISQHIKKRVLCRLFIHQPT